MHNEYRNPVMRHLRDQLTRYAPRQKKVEQISRAEKLIGEIEPQRTYTYEYLCFRITGYRPESFPGAKLSGEDASHDLRLFVEDISDSADLRADSAGERVLTVDQLSKEFERGSRFSQLSVEQRHEIIERARRMAQAGGCPSEISRRIAKRVGRSVETIRYTLRRFDKEHPGLAIFPDTGGPLTADLKSKIYQQYRRGTSVDALVKRYCRTKTTIYRVINEMRGARLLDLPLNFMPNPSFSRRGADKTCLAPMPMTEEQASRKARRPASLPPYLASLYEIPLFTREQEQHIFRKFNYLKYKASKLRESLDPASPKASLMDEIERLYEEAVATKNEIVRANLRLVVSIAKRHVGQVGNFFELVSDGNMSLLRAVEKFDYARGNKFSTYASWAVMKNFARTIPGEFKQQDRFRTSHDEVFSATEEYRSDQYEQESAQSEREAQIGKILRRLDEREQKIIIHRFGLDHSHEPKTLKEVGVSMGVTKERVRQIEARALNKLRSAAADAKIVLDLD